jgi:NAD(P)-dependent dehydrogenase (short-subunit alcohol dehydrogenase family)
MVGKKGSSVSIITGAASGLGRAAAIRLAGRGDRVGLCDLSEAGLEETCNIIRGNGGEATSAIVDGETVLRSRTARSGEAVYNRLPFSNGGDHGLRSVTWSLMNGGGRSIFVTGGFHVYQLACAHGRA